MFETIKDLIILTGSAILTIPIAIILSLVLTTILVLVIIGAWGIGILDILTR